jgi:peptidyl-prolyl cis-trans isomerase C
MLTTTIAHVNGIALHAAGEPLDDEALRQRASSELLRQAAQRGGLLSPDDPAPQAGVMSGAASEAIEQLLERQLVLPEPSEEACRRHYEANRQSHAHGERVLLRHVLFAVTPGVDVNALRARAEGVLLALRCATPQDGAFAQAAAQWSNCPSGRQGGELGWLTREDCASEFAREVFGTQEIGVLPRLVHSRFGLHVVEALAREPGEVPDFEQVRAAVQLSLRQRAWVTMLRQYLQLLAADAHVEGVQLETADSPLVQ